MGTENSTITSTEDTSHHIDSDTVISSQGLTEISETELMGEETVDVKPDETEPDVKPDVKPDETDVKPDETDELTDAEIEEALALVEATEVKPTVVDTKPPKGYVPTKAVQEARDENRFLKDKIADLEAKINKVTDTKPTEPADDPMAPFKDFKILNAQELKELVKEDPTEGIIYMNMRQAYSDAKREVEDRARSAEVKENQERTTIFQEANALMEEAVPGIFDKNSKVSEELVTFANDVGFTSDMFYLTNPETQVILPGSKEPVYLGTQAATMIKTLAKAREKANSAVNEVALREQIRKEELVKIFTKLKKSNKTSFRSIASLTDTEKDTSSTKFGDKVLSAREVEKLSEADKIMYLQGM